MAKFLHQARKHFEIYTHRLVHLLFCTEIKKIVMGWVCCWDSRKKEVVLNYVTKRPPGRLMRGSENNVNIFCILQKCLVRGTDRPASGLSQLYRCLTTGVYLYQRERIYSALFGLFVNLCENLFDRSHFKIILMAACTLPW